MSPTVPAAGQPVTISISKHLALKVEGVIEHSGKSTPFTLSVCLSLSDMIV